MLSAELEAKKTVLEDLMRELDEEEAGQLKKKYRPEPEPALEAAPEAPGGEEEMSEDAVISALKAALGEG